MSKASQEPDDRQTKALELRKLGVGITQIAEQLSCTDDAAHGLVVDALRAIEQETPETVAELRCLEAERLDQLLLAVAGQARKGHLGAVDRALRIMQRRSQLWGLDEPRQVKAKVKHLSFDQQYPELVAEAKSKTDEELRAILGGECEPE